MIKRKGLFCFVLLTLSLFFSCANRITDGGTGTGNAMVVGKLVDETGNPVAGATVRLIPVDYNPQQVAKRLAKMGKVSAAELREAILAEFDTAVTNDSGEYSFDSTTEAGTYNVLADSGTGKAAFQDSVTIEADTQTVVDTDTLKEPGTLRGVVRLQPNHDSRKVFIIALGTNTFATPSNTVGDFSLASMAEGRYSVRILSTLDDYDVLDTTLNVFAGKDTALADTVWLKYTGIPTPTGLKISYDTLKQLVTLTWNTPTTGRTVQGYNVYRKHSDSTSFEKIAGIITDTVYVDSIAMQGQTYQYKVAAVDTNDEEGTRSVGDSVTVVSAFTFIKDFGQQGTGQGQFALPGDVAFDSAGNVWIVDKNRAKVMKFDSSGGFLSEWGTAGTSPGNLSNPFGIDIGPQQNIVISEWQGTRIQKFDMSGNFVFEIDSTGIQTYDVSVDESGNIYFSMRINSNDSKHICKYDSNGNFIKSWEIGSTYLNFGILARDGKVYCAGASTVSGQAYHDNVIEVYDTTGALLSTMQIRQSGETGVISIRDLEMDNAGRIFATDPEYGKVRIFDENLDYLTSFGRKGNDTGDFSWIQGIAVSANGRMFVTDRYYVHAFQAP